MEKLQAAIRLKQVGGKMMRKTEYKVRYRRALLGKLYMMKHQKNSLWNWSVCIGANKVFSPVSVDLLEAGFNA